MSDLRTHFLKLADHVGGIGGVPQSGDNLRLLEAQRNPSAYGMGLCVEG